MLSKVWLGIRSVAMTVLFPGTVAGYIPYRFFFPERLPKPAEWSVSHYGACAFTIVGLAVLLTCVWEFAHYGRGTLAPFDEPRQLVVRGLYRYVRNPMYVGVLVVLIGEAWFLWSGWLLAYAGLFFVIVNVVVIAYEEPRLLSKFGPEYEAYRTEVRRWLPRIHKL